MKMYIVKYGLIGGAILIILGLLNWFFIAPYYSVSASQTLGYLGITLSLLCIPMGIKYFRDHIGEGQVSIGQALKIGISITLIVSAIMFFYGMLFHVFEGPEFQEWQIKDLTEEELENMKAQLAELPGYAMTPWFQGIVLFFMTFFMGLLMTLISGFVFTAVQGRE